MKKYFSILVLMLASISQTFAYDFEVDGIYYNVSGSNAEVTYKTYASASYSGTVVIPSTVTYNATTYKVTGIGEHAFYWCSNLISVTIPSSVTSIGEYAFYYCPAMTSVTIGSGVTSIGRYAFGQCTKLWTITIPNSVKGIGEYAFYHCRDLQYLTLGNNVTSIGNNAFESCATLTDLTIPDNVKTIGDYAFYECSGLTSATIGNNVTSIGKYAFYGCSDLENITIPDSVKTMGKSAFESCTSLEGVTIGNGLTSIPEKAFYKCTNLVNIWEMGNSVTSIGEEAFAYDEAIAFVSIGSNVRSIGEGAFVNCYKMNGIDVGDLANWCTIEGIENLMGKSQYLIEVCLRDHTTMAITEIWDLVIPEGVTRIPDGAFLSTSIKTVKIGSDVTSIGDGAFKDCNDLSDVEIPNIVTSIGNYAFESTSLPTITIPSSVTNIGVAAFTNCPYLTDVTCLAKVPPTIDDNGLWGTEEPFSTYGTLHVVKGYKDVYAAADYWKLFTIVDDIVDHVSTLTFNDGTAYDAEWAVTCDELTYARTFNNLNWQALYVPFSMDYEEWKDEFDIAKIHNFIEYDDNDDGEFDRTYLVVLKKTSGSTEPNTPYLIRAKETGAYELVLSNKILQSAESNNIDCSSTSNTYTFTGTYTPVTTMYANDFYAMSGGVLSHASSPDATLSPQRWYMSIAARSGAENYTKAQNIKILVDGEYDTESIAAATCATKEKATIIYDLAGRKVNQMNSTRGVQITNGKKIIK